MTRFLALVACAALSLAVIGSTAQAQTTKAELKNADGDGVGMVTLTETPHGALLVAELANLPPGPHAFHVHAVGKCEPPFKSAGGHYNPAGRKHGLLSPDGSHVGDMPNIHVGADESLKIEVLNTQLSGLDSLFDADGSAIVIHAGADDYTSDPAGAAGPRIACGVVSR